MATNATNNYLENYGNNANLAIVGGNPVEEHSYVAYSSIQDRKYEFDYSMKEMRQGNQVSGTWTCTYENKLTADEYFNAKNQDDINKKWLEYGNHLDETKPYLGLKPKEVIEWYKKAEYKVNEYSGKMNNQESLKWIYDEMKLGRIVQINYGTMSGHNITVKRIRFNSDFRDNIIDYMNPIRGSQNIRFRGIGRSVTGIYSVWRE